MQHALANVIDLYVVYDHIPSASPAAFEEPRAISKELPATSAESVAALG